MLLPAPHAPRLAPAVLAVCLRPPPAIPTGAAAGLDASGAAERTAAPDLVRAASGAAALDLLAAVEFDLVLVGPPLPDMPLAAFASALGALCPRPRWAVVTGGAEEERLARASGALAVLDAPPTCGRVAELAGGRRSPAARQPCGPAGGDPGRPSEGRANAIGVGGVVATGIGTGPAPPAAARSRRAGGNRPPPASP